VWHYYVGSALTLFVIAPDGTVREIPMGAEPQRGQVFQAIVPAGSWYGAVVDDPAGYALVGGTVAPGFDFADFELGDRAGLVAAFPRHRAMIERLSPPEG